MSLGRINSKYKYPTFPIANEKSIVQGDKYRFTILTSRLIRIEYNENGVFNDKATQCVINRQFDHVGFSVEDRNNLLLITTDHVKITYTKKPFSPNSLSVCYVGKNSGVKAGNNSTLWHYGQSDDNLFGTARTLDGVDGKCEIEKGIVSRSGITFIDDSNTLLLDDDGWVTPRKENGIDMYLFCYGDSDKGFDSLAALNDYFHLTGKTPLLPRFALGNWWSRYHAYTQEEYENLIMRFEKEHIPFSVAVIDMDWHYVDIEPKYGTGWTGYTWNENLFPNHIGFLEFLHKKGLKTSLSLHPQEGIAAHEKFYPEMAEAMGIDSAKEEKVDFDITNPKFMENYFEIMHRPLEKEGVDFWWMDWQQGNTTHVEGLDPLWMLNHYHYIDNGLSGKRPLMFSRYAGPGSHRYPIGFSGDTYVSWESLDFQPYFTATASNIGYCWWSHDIGGHMGGCRDDELTMRWVQLGVFSPINRLHSSSNHFMGKEPWKYNKICELSMKKFLKLRHELIPYLYTMNYLCATENLPLVMPLYYNWNTADAHSHKNEFTFGSQMLVAPITTPKDKYTQLGKTNVYLPEGEWYDFFNNHKYNGNRTLNVYRSEYDMPVFVKAGGIIPLAVLEDNVNQISNPTKMYVKVYGGKSNKFDLYEDDGITNDYKNGKYAITTISLDWSESPKLTINSPIGDRNIIPENRCFIVEFVGYNAENVRVNGCNVQFEQTTTSVKVCLNNVIDTVALEFINAAVIKNDYALMLETFLNGASISYEKKHKIYKFCTDEKSIAHKLAYVTNTNLDENVKNAITEILTADCD